MNSDFLNNKTILITGGTGTLGRSIIKKIYNKNCNIIIYSRDEGKQALYFKKFPKLNKVIGNVRDLEKLDETMKLYKPDYVIHTAALKRVDDMELYPNECIKTNVNGSKNVILSALNNNVKKSILISTDKACKPINVYGSTKFISEKLFSIYNENSNNDTLFSSVRYGNVIASRGSFIPLWTKLILNDEKIDITSMDCTRFLFTLNDAVEIVLKSLKFMQGGEIFIPEMNSFSMKKILDAIKDIHNIENIKYNIIGMRPGEKIHENLLTKSECRFAYYVTKKLLAVIPSYTTKKYSFNNEYKGSPLKSNLNPNDNINYIKKIINEGVNQSWEY